MNLRPEDRKASDDLQAGATAPGGGPFPPDRSGLSACGFALLHLPRRFLVLLVRLYQVSLSPLLGRQCRFSPTCSEYFIQAVRAHGAVRGAIMGIWRVLRCNPFGKGGYDPVK
jgi:hypothetical protein